MAKKGIPPQPVPREKADPGKPGAPGAAPGDMSDERRALIQTALKVRRRVRDELGPEAIGRLARRAGIKDKP